MQSRLCRWASSATAAVKEAERVRTGTVRRMMESRVHMGHKTSIWNPRMAPYILGERNGCHVIDLDQTYVALNRALTVIREMARQNCMIMWLGPKNAQQSLLVSNIAQQAGAVYLKGRWVGGTLTNPIASGQAELYGYRLPDCLVVLDTRRHGPALREARLVGIPTIGIVDTNCDPDLVTYPVPGNDEGTLALNFYCKLLMHAMKEGTATAQDVGGDDGTPTRPHSPQG